MTSNDLSWNLRTSLDRLLIQLWRSLVFVYFLVVRAPEHAERRLATTTINSTGS